MEKLQETYNLERKQLMQQNNLLQQELDTMFNEFNKEAKTTKKVDELNRTITALQKDKILVGTCRINQLEQVLYIFKNLKKC